MSLSPTLPLTLLPRPMQMQIPIQILIRILVHGFGSRLPGADYGLPLPVFGFRFTGSESR